MSHAIHERFCQNHGTLKESPRGVMVHYDVSSSDAGGLAYLLSAEASRRQVSYNFYVTRAGKIYRLVPPGRRAWHAGKCFPSSAAFNYRDANSAFVGVCFANNGKEAVTPQQMQAAVWLIAQLGRNNRWSTSNLAWLSGHSAEAFPRGRKQDPEGTGRTPIVSLPDLRSRVLAEMAR